jgi:hypothetical protein
MNQANTGSGEKETAEDERSLRELVVTTLWVLGCLVFVLVIAAIWFFISYAIDPRLTDPVQFIGVNVLNTLIFVAIVAQVMIYRKQRDIMKAQAEAASKAVEIAERQLKHDHRARLVIEGLSSTTSETQVLRIQNTGKLAADPADVLVDMIVLAPPKWVERANETEGASPLREAYDHAWSFNIGPVVTGRDLDIPLSEALTSLECAVWRSGNLRIIAQIQIEHGDGFGQTEISKRAFRFDSGKWKDWPVWTATTKEQRIAEEQARYHPQEE